ncbi:hypothetical protein EJ04DRAFT_117756 [Polyplosphaeria fusca]|uniref:Endonuclease/exonuclease/phosphatase domain-containing protein n=1 Tax=Polyplosphaeria fusca TaxID=682080 RepID=A0A9P4R5M2_9PLEO|nr:hypothetical protein EJ04DRAFT_117756 [Polyplosphaeria fusca]
MATNPQSKSTPILKALTEALKSGPASEREPEFYKPRSQSYWYNDGAAWVEASPPSIPPAGTETRPMNATNIRLFSWNIDILVGFAEERMEAALEYLCELVKSTPSDIPIVIFLQEMGQSDLQQIRAAPWVQKRFFMTELDERNWLKPLYGTTTLLDRRLQIQSVFRVPWLSIFDRDGLFVDVPLAAEAPARQVLRLCNTHLESLVAHPPVRPRQLRAAGEMLGEQRVGAALLAGDLNAIQPFDRTLHSDNGLKDAYLELGGKEDSDEGYTWGYQCPQWMREKFGCSRMDKILLCGGVEAKRLERIGVGVKVKEEVRERCRAEGEDEWVTDHYGIMGEFAVKGAKLVEVGSEGKASAKLS